jgi:hypothetical protein
MRSRGLSARSCSISAPSAKDWWRDGRVAARQVVTLGEVLTAFGVVVLTFMMLMYALERRGPRFILAFAVGCALSSSYGFLSGAWPFGIVEAIWTVIAVRRYIQTPRSS